MTLCIMCRKPIDPDQQRTRGFGDLSTMTTAFAINPFSTAAGVTCETCRERALIDEAIAWAAKVLKDLSGEGY